jgi:phosphoglycerate dehydrogenase-like enzyme
MPSIDTLAIALSPQETADFLPEPALSRMRSLARRSELLDATRMSREDYYARFAALDPDVLVTCWTNPPVPASTGRLRYVCHVAGGVRTLVTRAQLERGLILTNWGSSISRTVAECALLLVLATLRRAGHWIPAMHRDGTWRTDDRPEGGSLFGRTVGLHGFGQVARELIKLLAPFGVPIGVCAPETDPALYASHGVRRVPTLEELFSSHDVVVEVAPLNPATTGIVTERILRLMRTGACFVNVGRGKVVDEEALVRIAREGRIQVGLDVFATEPLPADSGLRGLPNAVLLPHTAGPTVERRCDAGTHALENLIAYTQDRPLKALITPEVYDAAP